MRKNIIIYSFCIFIAFIFWFICISNISKVYKFNSSVDLKYDNKKISVQQIKKIKPQNLKDSGILNLTAYHQYNNEIIYNNNKYSTQLDVINVYGNIENIFISQILAGALLSENDSKNCVIDKQSAYSLFGTENALGLELKWNNKGYIIQGILDCTQQIMFIRLDNQEQKEFSSIRINFENNDNTYEQARNFILNYNLDDATINDIASISIIVSQLANLPTILILAFIIFDLFKLHENHDNLVAIIILFILALLFIWILNFKIEIPSIYIPTKWSDFEFWTRTFKTIHDNYELVRKLPMIHTDLNSTIKTIILNICISMFAFSLALKFLEQTNLKQNFIYEMLTIMIIFISNIIIDFVSIDIIDIKIIWIIYPIFIFVDYIKNISTQ